METTTTQEAEMTLEQTALINAMFVNVSEYGYNFLETKIAETTRLDTDNGTVTLSLSKSDAEKLRDELTALIAAQ